MAQRDNTFDVMKGIGILAMVVGHCPIPELLNRFIFVWHMPLFFLVSGYFFRPKPMGEYMRSNARQLILPYTVTSLLMILLTATKQLATGKGDTMTMTVAALVGNGSLNNPTFSEYSIGAIWFLLAMFWCRSVYNVMCAKITDLCGGDFSPVFYCNLHRFDGLFANEHIGGLRGSTLFPYRSYRSTKQIAGDEY